MATLFSYNSPMSFGLSAEHFSVHKTEKSRFYYQKGTPQRPSKGIWITLTEEQEKEITGLKSCSENSEYIQYRILNIA